MRRVGPLLLLLCALPASHLGGQDAETMERARTYREAGDPDGALRALAGASGPEALYLQGRLAEEAADPAAAQAAYAGLELDALDWPAEVEADLRLRRGRLALAAGAIDAACADLAIVAPRSRRARALLAEAMLARARDGGAADEAADALRAAISEEGDDTDGFALRLLLVEALELSGRRDEALSTLRELLVERPEHPDDASAWAVATRLGGGATGLTLDERLQRITRLSERHHHEQALAECAALRDARGEDGRATLPERGEARAEALHAIGMAHYRARRAEAHALLTEAASIGGPHAAEDAFFAARTLHRARDDDEGVRALAAFVRAHPRDRHAVEAAYLAARSELDIDPARGRRSLRRFLAAHRTGDYAREARFRLAMDAFDRRRWDDAARELEAFARLADDALERLRARYWRARVDEARGARTAAYETYRAIVAGEPLHYYALLARQRLLRAGEPDPAPFPVVPTSSEPEAPIVWPAAAAFFRRLGLDEDAANSLRQNERALRAAHGLRALVTAYLEVGGTDRAHRLVAGSALLSAPLTVETEWAWRAAYPSAFAPHVHAAAAESGIEPALIWAVMRQESAFQPTVVSISDAIGLMQMLPATGARVAAALGLLAPSGRFSREFLFEPRVNIRLGARYLADLVGLVGVPAAFAAYNAGEHRVAEWWASPACRGTWELDRFVDWIPFGQTRNYVRRVTSHYLRYRYLEDPARGWPDVALPDTAGAGRACPDA
jgi:soluble lytic murein transglycosylase